MWKILVSLSVLTVILYLQIDCLSKAEVKVSHCPAAAMRMLGFAPIREMISAGICVSLGTDGAPSNNRMSLGSSFWFSIAYTIFHILVCGLEIHGSIYFLAVDEMYLASLINKGREVYMNGTTDPTALPSETVIKMATINGAKSVLWDNEIGSLEVGKKVSTIWLRLFIRIFLLISFVVKSSTLFNCLQSIL